MKKLRSKNLATPSIKKDSGESRIAMPNLSKKFSKLIFLSLILSIFSILVFITCFWIQIHFYASNQNYVNATQKLEDQVHELNKTVLATQSQVTILQNSVQKISQAHENFQNKVILLRVNSLLQLANFYLVTEKNVNQAKQLVTSASQLLSNSANFSNVRAALQQDLNVLAKTNNIDIEKIALQIDNINQELTHILVVPGSMVLAKPVENINVDNTEDETKLTRKEVLISRWHKFWQQSKNVLKQAFIIHKQEHGQAFLNIDAEQSVICNIQANLQIAKWALLQHQTDIYQSSLSQVIAALQLNFIHLTAAKKNDMVRVLQDLQKITLEPNLPNLNRSIQAIQMALSQ